MQKNCLRYYNIKCGCVQNDTSFAGKTRAIATSEAISYDEWNVV